MINPNTSKKINKLPKPNNKQLLEGILNSDRTALSRAITLVESELKKDRKNANQLLQKCLPHSGNSIRIGITGIPGVGKSTFIEALGNHLIDFGKKVAVLAIDPSSSINKGSILGDKTRMESLVKQNNAYIRPSAAGNSLGGVAKKTKESILLCEAAGYDVILIETVGVGQSETLVHSMVDFFLLLKIAGSGDELQGMKRGIIEMTDAIVINKADGDNVKNAQLAKKEFQKALHLYPPKENQWIPKVLTCSAIQNLGIEAIWELILEFIYLGKKTNYFNSNRINQNKEWLNYLISNQLLYEFENNEQILKNLPLYLEKIQNNEITPFIAAEELMQFFK